MVLGELRTGWDSEGSRLSNGLRILENEIDLEKKPAGRVSMEWEDEVEGPSEVLSRIWKGREVMEGSGKLSSCWMRVSGGFEGGLLDFEGLVLILDFLLETGRGGFGGNGGGGLVCLGGVVET